MTQVEKQIDDLTAKIENLSSNVDPVTTSVDKLATSVGKLTDTVSSVLDKVNVVDKWRIDVDKFVVDLESTMTNLTSRVLALEQAPKAIPPIVPSREEGGQASGHGVTNDIQGVQLGNFSPHVTLVKGEHKISQPQPYMLKTDYTASGNGSFYDAGEKGYQSKNVNRDFRMPRIDFPRFDGEHPRVWKEKCEKYFMICGHLLLLYIFIAMLHTGFKPLKHSIQTILGSNYV
jgi:hypothetical protein